MKQNKRIFATIFAVIMVLAFMQISAIAAPPPSDGVARATDNSGQYELTYSYIGILDLYGILGPTSHELVYSGFEIDGTVLSASDFNSISFAQSASTHSGKLDEENLWVHAKNEGEIILTIVIKKDVVGATSNVRFNIKIGEIQNSVFEIAYVEPSSGLLVMDAYGFTTNTIDLEPNDFTVKVNNDSVLPLGDFMDDYNAGNIGHVAGSMSISVGSGNGNGFHNTVQENAGVYTLTAPANSSNTTNNTSAGNDGNVHVTLNFPSVHGTNNINHPEKNLIVAKIYPPIMTAEGTTKEIALQKSSTNPDDQSYIVDLGPGQLTDTAYLKNEFPDFRLFWQVGPEEGEVTDFSVLTFGQLRVFDSGANVIRFLEREGSPSSDVTKLSDEEVDLWYVDAGNPFETQKIIANAENGTIEVTIQNVCIKNAGNGNSLLLSDKMNGGTPATITLGAINFVYKVTLIETFEVTLDPSGGTIGAAILRNTGGTSVTLPAPTRSGYTFLGWADVNGLVANPYIPTADVTLTAQWRSNSSTPGTPTTPTNPTTPTEPEEPDTWRPFDDVYVNDWYDGDTTYVWENDLMVGTAHRIFSPKMNMSRAMIVTALHRLSDEPAAGSAGFPDVPVGMWYNAAIAWAQEDGVVLGYGDGRFGPNDDITRQDLAVILVRYAESIGFELPATRELPDFADKAKIADYAQAAVEVLYQAEILNGKDNNLFDPTGFATRAEVAAVLHRFVELMSAA